MTALYNEIDDYAADWLENLIAAGLIAPGVVNRRSIVDLRPADLAGFTQVHFFAGIGGWSLAARLAGWPDDRPLWTGSCPCQPFSVAGKQAGQADERHLWPEFHRLIAGCRPPVVMGEQVAAAVGKSWLDGVCSDLEAIGYTTGAAVVPACAVDAPHRRDRLWFVADQYGSGWPARIGNGSTAGHRDPAAAASCADDSGEPEPMADGSRIGLQGLGAGRETGGAHGHGARGQASRGSDAGGAVSITNSSMCDGRSIEPIWRSQGRNASWWAGAQHVSGADGKARRVKPGIRLLAHGVSARVGKLRAFGNAIVPQVAAEIIGAYMDISAH